MIEFAAPWLAKSIVDPRATCKICGTESPLFDVVDFHKDCYEADGSPTPLSGIPVYYYCCPGCGFLFTPQFDSGKADDFIGPLAEAAESAVRPGLVEWRAQSYLALLHSWFGEDLDALRILVFGNIRLPALLRECGCAADGLSLAGSAIEAPSAGSDDRYDVILALDIAERIVDPVSMMREIDRRMVPDGLLLLSTRLSDGGDPMPEGIRQRPLRYVSPRMGQISIYSASSLALILGAAGFRLATIRQSIHLGDVHVGLRTVPVFARHLLRDWIG